MRLVEIAVVREWVYKFWRSKLEEFLEDLAERRVGLLEDLKTCQDPQLSDRMDESIQMIEKILEIDASRNSWLEEVEAALEAGRMPEGI